MPDPLKTIAQGPQGPERPPAEQYIAGLPGVGGGMLDTLRALLGQPLQFDTASAPRQVFGEFQRGTQGMPSRLVINPKAMEGPNAELVAPITLAHEGIAHGAMGLGSSAADEQMADMLGRSFIRETGRENLPFQSPREMRSQGAMRRFLESLQRRAVKEEE